MKWSKYSIVLITLLVSVGCQSQYGSRLVRVKAQPKTVDVRKSLHKSNLSQEPIVVLEEQVATIEPKSRAVQATVFSKPHFKRQGKNKRVISSFVAAYMDAATEPQDSVVDDGVSKEFIKERYRKANNYSIIAAILFVVTPLLLITILGAIIMSILAIRVYREYKNPGVRERYVLAITILVLSLALILGSFGLLYLIFIV
jgi:hypothetical protein